MKNKFKPLEGIAGLRHFMAIPMTGIEGIKRDIKELESKLKNIRAIEVLIEDHEIACKVVVCLPNDNVIEHWIDTNNNLWNTLYTERGLITDEIKELKAKLAELEAAEKGGSGPVEHEAPDPFAPITGPIAGIPLTENQEQELNIEAPSNVKPIKDDFLF